MRNVAATCLLVTLLALSCAKEDQKPAEQPKAGIVKPAEPAKPAPPPPPVEAATQTTLTQTQEVQTAQTAPEVIETPVVVTWNHNGGNLKAEIASTPVEVEIKNTGDIPWNSCRIKVRDANADEAEIKIGSMNAGASQRIDLTAQGKLEPATLRSLSLLCKEGIWIGMAVRQ